MKTRAAVAFEAKKPLEIVELDLEGPKAGEVLVEIKATKGLAKIPLVTQSRLSVMPIPKDAFERIVALGKGRKGAR